MGWGVGGGGGYSLKGAMGALTAVLSIDGVHTGSPAWTLCCKQVCPEVNCVYTAFTAL